MSWAESQLSEAVEILARRCDLVSSNPTAIGGSDCQVRGISDAVATRAAELGIDVELVSSSYSELPAMLGRSAPAILKLVGTDRYLAIISGGSRRVTVLQPTGGTRKIQIAALQRSISRSAVKEITEDIDELIQSVGVPAAKRERAHAQLLSERLGGHPLARCLMLRSHPNDSFAEKIRRSGLRGMLFRLLVSHLTFYLLFLTSWGLLGRALLSDRWEPSAYWAWVLVLLMALPFRAYSMLTQGRLSIVAGGLIKRHLLQGALRLKSQVVRQMGAGQLLARVLESNAVESLALSGGFLTLFSVIELSMASVVLMVGAGGLLHSAVLLVWICLIGTWAWHLYVQRCRWTAERLEITEELVEKMVGHRTRTVQEHPDHWHFDDDRRLDRYLESSVLLDKRVATMRALGPRGWMLLGIGVLAIPFAYGQTNVASLAVAFGGILLAGQGLAKLGEGLAVLSKALISWRQISVLFDAVVDAARPIPRALANVDSQLHDGAKLIDCSQLTFTHPRRGRPVFEQCDLVIHVGDRILLEGESGCGKSTLASIITGLNTADSGLVLAKGYDLATLGMARWRQIVAAAPQFHENHILTETLAFNLLMGRDWPPSPQDLELAETICHELGLGPLLNKMPSGLQQIVGETGWQLSHGERSRLFMARALLQEPQLLVLDESFGSLDPQSAARCLDCVLKRVKTLLVIAHP